MEISSFNKIKIDESNIEASNLCDERIREYWKVSPKEFEEDDLQFMNWFDKHRTIEENISSGYIDMNLRILSRDILRILKNPHERKCLEIGFGGGRIFNAACKIFKTAYGVDIHDSFKKVDKFLKKEQNNYTLIRPDDLNDIEDNSIDFIYSFIVFQHFHSMDMFMFYIRQIHRLLKPGMVFNIYYAVNGHTKEDYHLIGRDDIDNRGSSLFLDPEYAQKLFQDMGFKILKHKRALKKPWSKDDEFSNTQAYIVGIK